MHEKKFTIFGSHATKSAVERAAEIIFTACGLLAVVAVFSITLYMIISGTPALFKVGVPEILFGTVWKPTGNPASFGILYVIFNFHRRNLSGDPDRCSDWAVYRHLSGRGCTAEGSGSGPPGS